MTGKYERKFANILDANGYHVLRAPASGSVDRDAPDLFYSKHGHRPIAVELKTTSKDVAYFEQEEVEALERFAHAFRGKHRLGVRWKGDRTFYVFKSSDARLTPGNNYAVDKDLEPETTFSPD